MTTEEMIETLQWEALPGHDTDLLLTQIFCRQVADKLRAAEELVKEVSRLTKGVGHPKHKTGELLERYRNAGKEEN